MDVEMEERFKWIKRWGLVLATMLCAMAAGYAGWMAVRLLKQLF
jgi:hypothetical protein